MTKDRIFLFDLCQHLGYKTVAELENTMSYTELVEWFNYSQIKPFSVDRTESQLAHLLYMTAQNKDLTPSDFMISLTEDDKETIRNELKQQKLKKSLEDF